jgi:membrane-associated HD superfamily phosphohydrolase
VQAYVMQWLEKIFNFVASVVLALVIAVLYNSNVYKSMKRKQGKLVVYTILVFIISLIAANIVLNMVM